MSTCPFLLLFIPALLQAEPVPVQISFPNDTNGSVSPGYPILGNGGKAYWHDYEAGTTDQGYRILSYPGGVVASDPRTTGAAGDFPVGTPLDTHNGKLLVLGQYLEPYNGGYMELSTLVEYPAGTDLVTPFSAFPDGIPSNDSIQLIAGLYDSDGSVVFSMRQVQAPNTLFTAIARYSGGSITILAKSGETQIPGSTNTFTAVGPFSTQGGTTLFYGTGTGVNGLYQLTGGTITKVLAGGDPWPAGTGTVSFAHGINFDNEGQDVAVALPSFGGAVFKRVAGVWSLVAKMGDAIPNGNGVFYDLEAPAIHNGVVMFYGDRENVFVPPVQEGIYLESAAGGYAPVADLNDSFSGMTVSYMYVQQRYWDGENVVFNLSGPTNTANFLVVSGPGGTASTFRINSFSAGNAGGAPSFSFQTSNGVSYHIQQSSNLVGWTPVAQVTGDGTVKTVTNLPAGGPSQFYRVATP